MNLILIVDDDAEVREALRMLLAGIAPLSEASNGPEALCLIEARRPRLMLLDIAMHEMRGIAVLEAALGIDPSMTVLMLTAECDIDIAKDALGIGARAYITKPFDGPALRSQVEYLMTRAASAVPYKPWRVAAGAPHPHAE